MRICEINDILNEKLKLANQEAWDNSGLQIGDLEAEINGIVIALDLSEEVIDLAIKEKHNLIITHHPFLFSPVKSIDFSTYHGKLIELSVKNNINVVSLHTSLDAAINGITKELGRIINISDYKLLHQTYIDENSINRGFGGIGTIKRTTIKKLASQLKEALNCDYIKVYTADLKKEIAKVAFCGGSGADFIDDALKNMADIYITGDIKYHDAQYAVNHNLSIIDAGHFYTENIILDSLYNILSNSSINVIKFTKNTVFEYYL